MARVTVEDCKVQVPNRFDLVILASQRAKQIVSGSPLTIARDNDKDTVVALRELVNPEVLTELQITVLRKNRGIENENENEDEDEVNEGMKDEGIPESMGPAVYVDDVDEEEIEGFETINLDEEK